MNSLKISFYLFLFVVALGSAQWMNDEQQSDATTSTTQSSTTNTAQPISTSSTTTPASTTTQQSTTSTTQQPSSSTTGAAITSSSSTTTSTTTTTTTSQPTSSSSTTTTSKPTTNSTLQAQPFAQLCDCCSQNFAPQIAENAQLVLGFKNDATISVNRNKKYPFTATLFFSDTRDESNKDGAHCMGAFLSRFVVITAAHCFSNAVTNDTYKFVRVTDANYDKFTYLYSNWVPLSDDNYRIHESFDRETMVNNLALIYLTMEVVSPDIKPIAYDTDVNGKHELTLIGYGRVPNRTLRSSPVMLYSDTNMCYLVFKQEVCRNMGIRSGYNMRTKKSAICGLNSGSPLVYKRPGFLSSYHLIGLASFVSNFPCDLSTEYTGALVSRVDAYTHIPYYKDWIADNMASHSTPIVYESWGMSF